MTLAVEVNNFSFKYDDSEIETLKNINFEVKKGEIFGVIGPNSAGKSTLCNALVGLIPNYINGELSGTIKVLGEDTINATLGNLVTKIGLVFQNPFNQLSYTTSTVEEELTYGLGNLGVSREEMILRIKKVAKLMRIDHILDKNPLELSGGQVQRVALGSSIVMNPDIIVLDECTSQLDPLGSEEIFDIVQDLNKSGMTVILVDHDMERLARTADRIMILHEGEQVAIDHPRNIFSQMNISERGVGVPDFTKIYHALKDQQLYQGDTIIKEEEAVNVVKGVLEANGN